MKFFFFLRENLVINLNCNQWLLTFNKKILNRVVTKLCSKIIRFFIVLFLFFTKLSFKLSMLDLYVGFFLLDVNCEFFTNSSLDFFFFLISSILVKFLKDQNSIAILSIKMFKI